MNASILRQFWAIFETLQPSLVISLENNQIVEFLVEQLQAKQRLAPQEVEAIGDYIQTRIVLIRDLAQDKMGDKG